MINDYFFTAANSPAGASLQLVPQSPLSHPCATPFGKLSEFVKVFSVNPAGASLQLVPNSQFRIQNS